jgi:hypothetical protein
MIALVTTFLLPEEAGAQEVLEYFISHHLGIGFELIFLFVDASYLPPPLALVVSKYSDKVRLHFRGEELENTLRERCPRLMSVMGDAYDREVPVRQVILLYLRA